MPLFLSFFLGSLLMILIPRRQNAAPGQAEAPYLLVLGIAQDGGHPHAGCTRDCCLPLWEQGETGHLVSCLALVDPTSGQSWIFDATPDFPLQLYQLEQQTGTKLAGIFLTHAHIGHYTGLIHLGREVMGAANLPVYALPKMAEFLKENGPWSQLVKLKNIDIQTIQKDRIVQLTGQLRVTPFQVPHRDEYSETVGYRMEGPAASALFIPDIDKWSRWEQDIVTNVEGVDYAFIDGSFFQDGEIKGRSMSEIPHPFIQESMNRFHNVSEKVKNKVFFIHLNHTNPVLSNDSEAYQEVIESGFNVAQEGGRVDL